MEKLLVILGPTATGKTDLALQLASKFRGELVSVDSRQVYVGLDIGTGKLPGGGKWARFAKREVRRGRGFWEIGGIRVWMYDVVNPKKQYTVVDFVKDANSVVREVGERGKLPIIVGGTGLYLKALLGGLPNLAIPTDRGLRKKLDHLSLNQLQNELQKLSSEKWQKMNQSDRQNPRRLVRAIELEEVLGNRGGKGNWGYAGLKEEFDVLKIGLTASRQVLYKRVDDWVVKRIKQGMIEEAKKLHQEEVSFKRMRQLGLVYGVLADFLQGRINNKKELIKIMQNKIHGYVRRQLTWFKNPLTCSGYIHWFDITDKGFFRKIENLVAKWYDSYQ